jgi:hypothetical protein
MEQKDREAPSKSSRREDLLNYRAEKLIIEKKDDMSNQKLNRDIVPGLPSPSEKGLRDEAEFYIGWMSKMPDSYSKPVVKIVILFAVAVIGAACIMVWQEEKFSSSVIESQFTQVKGIFQQAPIPSLKVVTQHDALGNTSYITIPLVGYGKFGAQGTIDALEKEKGFDLNNKEVILKGYLQYNDGKTLMQIDKNDAPLVNVTNTSSAITHQIKELGIIEVKGEIIDPKCYFGAMKPGHSKPHRDCAIRCIDGGMDPILYVRDKNGNANYYLVLGPDGKRLNQELKDHIAEPISVKAKAVQYDDWVVLYLDPAKDIKRLGILSWFKLQEGSISCGPLSK